MPGSDGDMAEIRWYILTGHSCIASRRRFAAFRDDGRVRRDAGLCIEAVHCSLLLAGTGILSMLRLPRQQMEKMQCLTTLY